MTAFLGMDPAEVRNLAGQLKSSAGEIQQIINTIGNQLNNTQWVGSDATRFRDDWQSTYVSQLTTVMHALDGASTNAIQNAAQQEQASS